MNVLQNVRKRASSTSNLYSNAWSLLNSEFEFFTCPLRSLLWSRGDDQPWFVPFLLRNIKFYLMFFRDNLCIAAQLDLYMYNILSTYALVMLSLQWIPTQYLFSIIEYLKLSRQILIVRFLLKKRHAQVKCSLPIGYWVNDKDISIKMSSTHVWIVTSIVYISTATE